MKYVILSFQFKTWRVTMFKRWIFMLISATILVALYGCHAGGDAPFINRNEEVTLVSRVAEVKADGTFPEITMPSGATVKCDELQTLKPGTTVTMVEQKMAVENNSNEGTPSYVYIYTLTASLKSENPLESAVSVNTVEKPITITIPNTLNDSGTYYIGIRDNENSPWRYTLATDGISANFRAMRLATRPTIVRHKFYQFGIDLRLFVIKDEDKKDKANLETVTLSQEKEVEIKDGKYNGNLSVKLNIEGDNLNGIKAEDLIAKIIYRSNKEQGADIGFATNKTNSNDKAVTGTYEHSFEISNIKIEKTVGNTAELSFDLNLDGISQEDFPTDFIVNFYSKGENKDTLPFYYTQAFGFETKEQQDNPQPQPQPKPVEVYSITYNYNGGVLPEGVINPESYDEASDTIILNNPKKEGYSFEGWTGSNGDTPERVVKIEKGTTGNKTYTANYSAVAYTITYVLGADDVINDNPTGYNPDSETFTLNEPERTGYSFTGWTGSNGDTPQTSVTISKGSSDNKSYTANWSINSYNLTINKGTGIDTVTGDGSHEYNSSITASCTMIAGYDFSNWTGDYTSETFTMPAKDVTITANAKPISYCITYSLAEGAMPEGVTNPANYDVTSSTITLKEPTREGYTFTGWTGSNGSNPQKDVQIEKGTTGDKSYTANWSINSYNLTINKGASIDTVTGNGSHEYNSSVTASCTMLTGYEFANWTGDFTTETFTMPAKDVTITANAKPISYNIGYTLNDGTVETANPEKYDITSATIILNNPTRENYDFLGWEGTDIPENTASMTVKIYQGSYGNRNYVASFTERFTITYQNISGCTFTTTNPATYNEFTNTITLNNPSKTGYEFTGWTYDGQNTPTTTVTIPRGSTGNKEFTANFNLILTLSIPSDTGAMYAPISDNVYKIRPTFTINPVVADGVTLNSNQQSNILGAIYVKLSSGGDALETLSKSWQNGKIVLSFTENLSFNTSYTIYCDSINEVNLTYSPLSFTTISIDGSGTNSNPYLVKNPKHLELVRDLNTSYFQQDNDIDLAEYTDKWIPICDDSSSNVKFTGSYDGNNKKIKNLKFHSSDPMTNVGLFGTVDSGGKIENLTIDGISMRGASSDTPLSAQNVGVIACTLNSGCIITNCHLTDSSANTATDSQSIISVAKENSRLFFGGICNYNNGGTISNCSVEKCKILSSTEKADSAHMGGICYSNSGTIRGCTIDETILDCSIIEAYHELLIDVGGICSVNYNGSIETCSVNNSYISLTTADGDSELGGICAENNQTISRCNVQNTRLKVTGGYGTYSNCIGGICCESSQSSSITSCYVKDSVIEGTNNSNCIGGIVEEATATNISSCYLNNTVIKTTNNSTNPDHISGICLQSHFQNNNLVTEISACYVYGGSMSSPVANSKINYFVEENYGTVSDCFTNLSGDYELVIDKNNGTHTNCYKGITVDNIGGQTWSDGKAYTAEDSVWKDFDFSSFPPTLKNQ